MKDVDAELREYLDTMEHRIIAQIKENDKQLETRIDAQGHTLRTEMIVMKQELAEAIRHRREDEDLAFKEIMRLEGRMNRLERRVETLETRSG